MKLADFLEHLNLQKPVFGGTQEHKYMCDLSNEAMKITSKLNSVHHEPEQVRELFFELIGKPIDHTFMMFTPFYTDCGKNIHVQKNVFINAGCKFQDQGGIYIGENCLIGHNVVIATLNHGIQPADRATLYPQKVVIENNVWIGANATILPGVTIGQNAIVAAGSVVSKNVAPNIIVAGVPAKFIKKI